MLENNDWPTLQNWAYELLLEWSRQDPVDNIEKDRNEAVYSIQGNRNPFIDYPYLAEYIWGDSITYAFSVEGSSQGGDVNPPVDPIEPDLDVVLCDENFCSSQGEWTISDVELGGLQYVWYLDSKYGMKASAYTNNTAYATESWLISPEYDLTGMASAEFTFSHTGRFFGTMTEEATLWVSTDNGATWEQLDISTYMTGNNWTYVTSTQDLSPLCGIIGKLLSSVFLLRLRIRTLYIRIHLLRLDSLFVFFQISCFLPISERSLLIAELLRFTLKR